MREIDRWSQVLFAQSFSGVGAGRKLSMIVQVMFIVFLFGLVVQFLGLLAGEVFEWGVGVVERLG